MRDEERAISGQIRLHPFLRQPRDRVHAGDQPPVGVPEDVRAAGRRRRRQHARVEAHLRPSQETLSPSVPPMIQETGGGEVHSLETETALMELRERTAEINSFALDFLMVSSTTNQDDMDSFIQSLRTQGFATDLPPVHQAVAKMIMELDYRVQNETTAATAMPQSWSEREALRRFEEVRSTLRDRLENILALHQDDIVKARMAFEQEGRELNLDLRVPSVSGRLHALFDLHIEIAESQALHDPVVQRRQRMLRILHRGAVHMHTTGSHI